MEILENPVVPWLGLAVAVVGFLGIVTAWFSTEASDGQFLLYVVMVLGGLILFGVLI